MKNESKQYQNNSKRISRILENQKSVQKTLTHDRAVDKHKVNGTFVSLCYQNKHGEVRSFVKKYINL